MKIKNYTPHPINLLVNGEFIEYPVCGPAPRLATHIVAIEGDYPFEAVKVEYGDVQDLPEPEEDVILIVSKMCCDAVPDRPDLWYPTEFVRDEQGRITGCRALARV